MGLVLHKEPKLENPAMVASWSGIGNVGLIALGTFRAQVEAEELGEIEPWDYFYPSKSIVRGGVLEEMEFPGCRFFYKNVAGKDLIFFLGEEQPADGGGKKGYELANLVLDVAEKFGCRRIYTLGAAVAPTHHTLKPRVWVAAGREELLKELRGYSNTIGMSQIEGRGGSITGLNGLLFGLSKKRGFDAFCLMGEIPDYISGAPFPYPRASRAVLEIIANYLGASLDYSNLDDMIVRMDEIINGLYDKFPADMKERIEQRKLAIEAKPGAISEEEEKWLKEHIDELFKKGNTG